MPFWYGQSLNLEKGAWLSKIRQKNRARLRPVTTMVERKACFMRNQMTKGQSQSRSDRKSKLRASQSQSSISQSEPSASQGPNSEREGFSRGIPWLSSVIVVRWRGARFFRKQMNRNDLAGAPLLFAYTKQNKGSLTVSLQEFIHG